MIEIDINALKGVRTDTYTSQTGKSANAKRPGDPDFQALMMSIFPAYATGAVMNTENVGGTGFEQSTVSSEAGNRQSDMEMQEIAGTGSVNDIILTADMTAALGILNAAQTNYLIPDGGEQPIDGSSPEINATDIDDVPAYIQAQRFRGTDISLFKPESDLNITFETVTAGMRNTPGAETERNVQGRPEEFLNIGPVTRRQPSGLQNLQELRQSGENAVRQNELASPDRFRYIGMPDNQTGVLTGQKTDNGSRIGNRVMMTGKETVLPSGSLQDTSSGRLASVSEFSSAVIETKQPLEANTLYALERARWGSVHGQPKQDGGQHAAGPGAPEEGTFGIETGKGAKPEQEISGQDTATVRAAGESGLYGQELREAAEDPDLSAPDVPAPYSQIAAGIETGIRSNAGSRFKVRLKPEGLGEITVEMLQKEGRVQLKITTDRAETEKLLNAEIESLRESLKHLNAEIPQVTSAEKPQEASIPSERTDMFFTTEQQNQRSFGGGRGGSRDAAVLRSEVAGPISEPNYEAGVYLNAAAGYLNIYA